MGPEVIVATLLPLAFFALVFGIFYIRNRENMALIEKGINPRQTYSRPKPFVNLKWGLLFMGSGLGLLIAYFIDMSLSHRHMLPDGREYNSDNPAIYFALIAIGGGIGLVISYFIEKKHWFDKIKQD